MITTGKAKKTPESLRERFSVAVTKRSWRWKARSRKPQKKTVTQSGDMENFLGFVPFHLSSFFAAK